MVTVNLLIHLQIFILEILKKKYAIDELQNFCKEYFGHFFSVLTLISSIAIIERKKVELEKEFDRLLMVWNEM